MARGRRPRNRAAEADIGRKQAAMLGVEPDQLIKAIDAREGDYYRADLYPAKGAYDAYTQIGFTRSNSPLVGLQNDILADMQRFYGLNSGQPVTRELVSEASQQPAQALYQSASARTGPPAQHPVSLEEGKAIAERRSIAYEEPIGPDPKQQAANDLKDDYVNHTVGYDVQTAYDSILVDMEQQRAAQRQVDDTKRFVDDRIKELEDGQWMTGSQMGDLALLGGSSLLAGGLIGRASAPKNEEEF